jgi:hypothetical protein
MQDKQDEVKSLQDEHFWEMQRLHFLSARTQPTDVQEEWQF